MKWKIHLLEKYLSNICAFCHSGRGWGREAMGQVMRSLVGLYKNLNLTLGELENHWGIGHGSDVIGLKFEEDPWVCRVESGSSEIRAETEAPGQAAAVVQWAMVEWVDRSSLEEHERLALLRFLWSLHQKSWTIKSLGICVGLTPHPSSLSEL